MGGAMAGESSIIPDHVTEKLERYKSDTFFWTIAGIISLLILLPAGAVGLHFIEARGWLWTVWMWASISSIFLLLVNLIRGGENREERIALGARKATVGAWLFLLFTAFVAVTIWMYHEKPAIQFIAPSASPAKAAPL